MLVSYVLAAAALSLSAAEFESVPTAEKIRHPDLLFCVTFDNYSTRADLAKFAVQAVADSREAHAMIRKTPGCRQINGWLFPIPFRDSSFTPHLNDTFSFKCGV